MAKRLFSPFKTCWALLPLFLLLLASCSDDKEYVPEEEAAVEIEGDYIESKLWISDEKIIATTWIDPSVSDEFASAIRSRINNVVTSADQADVIVTNKAGYNPKDLAFGRIAIVYDPSDELASSLGVIGDDDDILCVGIQEGGGHFLVSEPEKDADIPASLNSLISWVNSSTILNANGFKVEDYSCGASYSGTINNKICQVALSKPDYLKGTYDVSVNADITPLHVFKSNQNQVAMDYYIVTLATTVESKNMYKGNFTKKHGGVRARICGYYLKNLNIDASVTDSTGKSVNGVFFQSTPTPETTIGATTYSTSSGFSFSGGLSTGPNIGNSKFGYTHSSTVSRTISDCEIINLHNKDVAKFQYKINNLPSYNSKIRINNPPKISISSQTFYSQWIWAVPTKDNDENTEYMLKISLHDFVYGVSYFYSSKADYHDLDFKINDADVLLKLKKPIRYPVGSVKILNNVKGSYLTYAAYEGGNVKIEEKYNQYKYNDTCVTYLPVGYYTLTCKMKGKDKTAPKEEFEYIYQDKIKVLMGETTSHATNEKEFTKK